MKTLFEHALNSIRTNQNWYRAWDKSKQYGKLRHVAFLMFSIIPCAKMLCGKGRDYIEKLKKDGCILQLEGTDVKDEEIFFYLPNFEKDFIQKLIVATKNFYERPELAHLQRYIRNGDVCLDIGANIGNHSIYYSKICRVAKVFAFEPVKSTFSILKKNIELNHLEKRVEAHNVGLSDRTKLASVCYFDENNIGSTELSENDGGDLQLVSLDEMNFPCKIDFVKIDVENMEYDLLRGAKQFFARHTPVVYIEILDNNFKRVDSLLHQYGYLLSEKRPAFNYVYRHSCFSDSDSFSLNFDSKDEKSKNDEENVGMSECHVRGER